MTEVRRKRWITLDPWLVRWEQGIAKALLAPEEKGVYFAKFNVDGLLRGDYQSRMHILRHTFATRCIEGGMLPKTLQKILGHSNISLTMNLYVHITDEEKQKEMGLVAAALNVG